MVLSFLTKNRSVVPTHLRDCELALIRLLGAKKLVAQQPLTRLVPTDEFVPIMFDQHPNAEWKQAFGPRNLQALAIEPKVCEPVKFTKDPRYSSDTGEKPEKSAAAAWFSWLCLMCDLILFFA